MGGTIGLAITGSLFTTVLLEEVPKQLVDGGVPPAFADAFTSGGGQVLNQIAGVGDLGAAILAQVPPEFQAQVEPFIPAIVDAIHTAFAIATGATFVIGIVTALMAAAVVAIWMPNTRMREMAEQRPESAASQLEPATD